MPTTIATISGNSTDGFTLAPVSFTKNTNGFLQVVNDTTSDQGVTARCYAGSTAAYGYSGTLLGNTSGDIHSLYVPIDPTITSVKVLVASVSSSVDVDLIGKNLMSTITIDAMGQVTGPDGTANVTCTGAPLSVANGSTTTYQATLGTSPGTTSCPGGITTHLPATTQDYVAIRSTVGGDPTYLNIRHVDKSVVVIDSVDGAQTGYPAIIAPSVDGYVYLVNLAQTIATVWMAGYVNATWTKQSVIIPGGGVYQGSLSSFADPIAPPTPAPPNYQVALGFEFTGDPTIAIKRPNTVGA
jgi:hypothetical protein